VAAPAGPSKTVLIADDTAFVRDRFASALGDAGHRAVTAQSASELLARLRNHGEAIDLIVMDLRLPHSRGVDLVRAIRQYDGGRIPVLVFSGTIASADEVRELTGLGVAGYVNEYSAAPNIVRSLAPHLFPDNFNRRSSPRANVAVAISYRMGNTIASAVTLNIGKGGVGVRTMTPLPSGTTARLRFKLPGQQHDIEAEAHVCWTDRNLGMGLQFERISPAHQAALDEFVERHFFSNRKA
jgi:uncharacterized protein (TIGR02266 family)